MNMQLKYPVIVHSRVLRGFQALPVMITACTEQSSHPTAEDLSLAPRRRIADGSEHFIQTSIIGWPAEVQQETIDHLRQEILEAGFEFPSSPCVLRVQGTHTPGDPVLQLPLAIAFLRATGQLPVEDLEQYEFYGELAWRGGINAPSKLPLLVQVAASRSEQRCAVVPRDPRDFYQYAVGARTLSVGHLAELCLKLQRGDGRHSKPHSPALPSPLSDSADLSHFNAWDSFTDVLVCAAAGGHGLFIDDQSDLHAAPHDVAACLRTLLPPLEVEEAFMAMQLACRHPQELTNLHGNFGYRKEIWGKRQIIALDHCHDKHFLGNAQRIGCLSLAHQGIALVRLSGLASLSDQGQHQLLECVQNGVLRWPTDDGEVCVPTQVQPILYKPFVGFCACGLGEEAGDVCQCSQEQIAALRKRVTRLSILDHCPLRIALDGSIVRTEKPCRPRTSAQYAQSIARARRRQFERSQRLNAQLTPEQFTALHLMSALAEACLAQAARVHTIAESRLHALRTVALTIADLAGSETIEAQHMQDALERCGLGEIN
jgi:magnesium chelatase family protein